jgi:uncharacterized delta-60 repeat protein
MKGTSSKGTTNRPPAPRRSNSAARIDSCEPRILLFAGQLDVSFGDLGTASRSLNAPIIADPTAAVRQPDGKILLAGAEGAGTLARYLPDGRLDPSFADAGRLDPSTNTTFYSGASAFGAIRAVLVQTSGRILVVSTGRDCDIFALRPDGSPDTSFGNSGVAHVGSGLDSPGAAVVRSAALLPDGSILVGASIEHYDYNPGHPPLSYAQAAWTHVLPDGAVDPAYDGRFRTLRLKHVGVASLDRLALLPNGAGAIAVGHADDDVLLVRLTPDGYATRAFGDAGTTTTDFGRPAEAARAVAALPDGSIVLAADSAGDVVLAR